MSCQVGIISDIHGNFAALKRVLERLGNMLPAESIILNAGDNVGYGEQPEECVKLLMRSSNISTVQGNYDRHVALYPKNPAKYIKKWSKSRPEKLRAVQRDSDIISDASRAWLSELPTELRTELPYFSLSLTHYSPGSHDSVGIWTSETQFAAIANRTDAGIIVTGHTHSPVIVRLAGRIFVNPGSVGRSPTGNSSFSTLTVEQDGTATVKQFTEGQTQ